jgi:hypothetical protein
MRNYSEVSVPQQITKLRGEDATRKAPTDHHRKPIWLTAGSLWGFRAKQPVLHAL